MTTTPPEARIHASADLWRLAFARPPKEPQHDSAGRLLLRRGVPTSGLTARRTKAVQLLYEADDAADHDGSLEGSSTYV